MIYLDTSAMVKLVVREEESGHLIEWLNNDGDVRDCCTAQIGRIELMRAALRVGANAQLAIAAARHLLDRVDTLLMAPAIAAMAETIGPAELRTLDALHLATILVNRSSVTAVCAYDRRLIAACEQHALTVVTPGQDRGDQFR